MFKTSEAVESRTSSECLPSGLYRVVLNSIELKPTKAGNGQCFHLLLTVVQPDNQNGAQVKDYMVWEHSTATAQEIGRAKLGDLLFTLQVSQFSSIDELKRLVTGKEFLIETICEEAELSGRIILNSRVDAYFSIGGKHRSEKRSLKIVTLGTNGKEPLKLRVKPVAKMSMSNDSDIPF